MPVVRNRLSLRWQALILGENWGFFGRKIGFSAKQNGILAGAFSVFHGFSFRKDLPLSGHGAADWDCGSAEGGVEAGVLCADESGKHTKN